MSTDVEGDLEVRPGLVLPASELRWRYTSSGGPGGQHANRSQSKAIVRFDIEHSTALNARQRERLMAKLGPEIEVGSEDNRSQWQNRRVARKRLAERLASALVVPRSRKKTRPSRGAVQRRLNAKSRRSEVKRGRQRPRRDD